MSRSIIMKKVATIAMAILMMITATCTGTLSSIAPSFSISASAATTTLTSSNIDEFQRVWGKHPYVLKKFSANNKISTGKKCVKDLQLMLNFTINANLTIDSIFGNGTEKAVKNFQAKYGLSKDGIVGNGTWKKLISVARSKISSSKTTVTISISGVSFPSTIKEGTGTHINGNITCNGGKISSITATVSDSNGKVKLSASCTPNTYKYSLYDSNLDYKLSFGKLSAGSYKLTFTAKAPGTSKSTSVSFKVQKNSSGASTNTSVAAFQKKALNEWVRPVKAKVLNVYTGSGREFGSYRTSNRYHAGTDFVTNAKSPVYAMQSGTVIEYIGNFWAGTSAVAIKHSDGSIARYCEISTNLRVGNHVRKGDKIGNMKFNTYNGCAMLHLELYLGTSSGSLTNSGNTYYKYVSGVYMRRSDLVASSFAIKLK